MRHLIIFCLLFLTANRLFSQASYSDQYVASINGMNLRDTASTQGQIIATLPFETKVTVLTNQPHPTVITIDDRPGQWLKVRYKEQEGFLFSAFLSPFTFTEITGTKSPYDYQSNLYVLRFLDKYISDSLVYAIPTLEALPSVGGTSYDFQVYADGSNCYRHYVYEAELYTIESSKIDPNNFLNFLNYLNALYNRGKVKYLNNVTFSTETFPQAHKYVAAGTFSYIYSCGFIVENNRVKVVLDMGLTSPVNSWPRLSTSIAYFNDVKTILTDLNSDGLNNEVKVYKSSDAPTVFWAISSLTSTMPHRKILSTSMWLLENRLFFSSGCELQYTPLPADAVMTIQRILSDGSIIQGEERVKLTGKSIIFQCGAESKKLLLFADDNRYQLAIVKE